MRDERTEPTVDDVIGAKMALKSGSTNHLGAGVSRPNIAGMVKRAYIGSHSTETEQARDRVHGAERNGMQI